MLFAQKTCRTSSVPRPARRRAGVLCAVSFFASIVLITFMVPAVPAQMSQQPQSSSQPRGAATVVISVRSENGSPLDNPAEVTLAPEGQASGQMQSTGSNGVARFSRVPNGSYTVSIRAPGYKDSLTEVDVPMSYGTFDSTVNMQPDIQEEPDAKGIVLAPKAKKELDAGMVAMRAGKYDDAQKHLEAAYKLAPGSPDVNDLLGELFLLKKDYPKSQDYLAQALSIDPQHISALTDMGELRVQQGDYVAAQVPLERSIELFPQNWFAHWMLGVAYLRVNENEKARLEALAAIKTGKGAANAAGYLLGESLAALGRNAEAVRALQAFLVSSPKNSFAPSAQALIAKLQSPPVAAPLPLAPAPAAAPPAAQAQTP